MDIEKFSLRNGGGFVAKLHVVAAPPDGGSSQTYEENSDIPLGQEKTVDLGSLKIPEGSRVKLKAFVVWGNDNVAEQAFIYRKGTNKTARYSITGTTLDNQLGLIGVQ
ncbi:hypothetical protein EQ718_16545 (plasmid) [Paracoccus versutus]|jgi:hypothetical protein|uniref:Uncharacterized protein n=1 Tax=Paracoccus versutus TaxID=34007 RepID=A0AAQ0KJS6_PARVE|nr:MULTISPECIES: hypothetical protein [Paracoccus]WGR61821.1 hypothetical protein E3U26_13680 [Paracoccus ferrooxidans]SFX67830.1 hypothetical protein SAMN04244548_01653 [Paracoccus pantotrophus]KGJ12072.1 hypothetical protein IT40_03195 [Paracoccus versutus]MBT0782696.1 hypothetical protein [Paracoccus sp. pheM1]MCJ1901991.1 hypothetical protein [Paracoccus versutus]